jgi:hypothetical protein
MTNYTTSRWLGNFQPALRGFLHRWLQVRGFLTEHFAAAISDGNLLHGIPLSALSVTAVTSASDSSDIAWIEGRTMSSWGCPHEWDGMCQKVRKLPCDPGMSGCVLYGRFVFSNPAKNRLAKPSARNTADEKGDQPASSA